jgi:hypothetical protein
MKTQLVVFSLIEGAHCGSEFIEIIEESNAPEHFEPYVVKQSYMPARQRQEEQVPQVFFIEQTISRLEYNQRFQAVVLL